MTTRSHPAPANRLSSPEARAPSRAPPPAHVTVKPPFPVPDLSPDVVEGLREVIRDYPSALITSLLHLEPRGLVNTGNLCFMNSILQVCRLLLSLAIFFQPFL